VRRRRTLAIVSVVAGALVSTPAALADSCSFDAATRTVSALHDQGSGMAITRSGKAIIANSANAGRLACGTATVRNTDTIVFHDTSPGGGFNSIDLQNGAFAPGATKELTGKSEIEISFIGNGSALDIFGRQTKSNKITIGAGGFADPSRGLINLNNDDDADITYSGMAPGALAVYGGAASDILSAAGGKGTGGPATTGVLLRGAPNPTDPSGPDKLFAGAGSDFLQGALGNDLLVAGTGGTTMQGGGGDDLLRARNGVADTLDGGPGNDTAFYDCALDTVTNVESSTCG
jgi:hypothetical protein